MTTKHITIDREAAQRMLSILDATNDRPLFDADLRDAEMLADVLRERLGLEPAPPQLRVAARQPPPLTGADTAPPLSYVLHVDGIPHSTRDCWELPGLGVALGLEGGPFTVVHVVLTCPTGKPDRTANVYATKGRKPPGRGVN